jgi:hypothetical protein
VREASSSPKPEIPGIFQVGIKFAERLLNSRNFPDLSDLLQNLSNKSWLQMLKLYVKNSIFRIEKLGFSNLQKKAGYTLFVGQKSLSDTTKIFFYTNFPREKTH